MQGLGSMQCNRPTQAAGDVRRALGAASERMDR